jgi:YebC/PmpR family DNA-binding regulatory protein
MSGHNKWSKIKHKKAVTDAAKSKIFSKMAKLISTASKQVNGDTTSPILRAAIEKAREYNMPTDNIERAIKKGSGADAESMESITYEAYGPGGCALIIEVLTSNRNKASQEVKFILSKNGFELAAPGSATWPSRRKATPRLRSGQAGFPT